MGEDFRNTSTTKEKRKKKGKKQKIFIGRRRKRRRKKSKKQIILKPVIHREETENITLVKMPDHKNKDETKFSDTDIKENTNNIPLDTRLEIKQTMQSDNKENAKTNGKVNTWEDVSEFSGALVIIIDEVKE